MVGPTNPTETYFDKGLWGHDGSQWRKLNLLFGYYDRLVETKSIADASAGANAINHTAVPTGEVWIVKGHNVLDSATAANAQLQLWDGTTAHVVNHYGALTIGQWSNFSKGDIVLKAGDLLICYFSGCTLHDVLQSSIWGYKMKVS